MICKIGLFLLGAAAFFVGLYGGNSFAAICGMFFMIISPAVTELSKSNNPG